MNITSIVRIGVFVSFFATAVYGYGDMDAMLYKGGMVWIRALSVFHSEGFGMIYIPTLLLCVHGILSWHFSKYATVLIMEGAMWVVCRLQRHEEVEIYGDAESS